MANARSKAAAARRASQSRRTVGQNNTQGPKLPKSQQSYTERRADLKQTRSEQTTARGATRGNSNVTTSSSRSARGRAGEKAADKKTTSSGRGAGKTPTVDSRTQRQNASNAKVTSSGGKGSGNAVVTKSGGKVASGPSYKAPSVPKPVAGAAKGAAAAAGKAAAATAAGKLGVKAAAVYAGLNAGPVADGTMKGKVTGPKKGPAASQPKNFNEALKQARTRGVKEFTYKGKRYQTRRADGK